MLARYIWWVALALWGTSAWADEVCTVEPSFGAFLEVVARTDPYRPLTEVQRMEILSHFNRLNETALESWLAEPDRSTLQGPVAGVLKAAREAATSGRVDSLVILQAHIRRFEVGMAGLCNKPVDNIAAAGERAEKLPGHGGPVEQAELTEETREVVEDSLDLTVFAQALGGIAALAVTLQLTLIAISWWKAKLFRRQGCRIRADLKIGRERLEGHIVVLGRKGCLVEPRDRYAFEKLDRLAGTGPEKLLVFGKEVPCQVTKVDNHGAGIKFTSELGLVEQHSLLKQSVITPFLILGDAVQNGKYPWWHRLLMRMGVLPEPAGNTQSGVEEEGEAIQQSQDNVEIRIRHPKRRNVDNERIVDEETLDDPSDDPDAQNEIDASDQSIDEPEQDTEGGKGKEIDDETAQDGGAEERALEGESGGEIEEAGDGDDPLVEEASELESEESELSEEAAVSRAVFMPRSSRARATVIESAQENGASQDAGDAPNLSQPSGIPPPGE